MVKVREEKLENMLKHNLVTFGAYDQAWINPSYAISDAINALVIQKTVKESNIKVS